MWVRVCPCRGSDPLVEATPLPEVGGCALYHPFEKGFVQGHMQGQHMFPGNELGWKSVRGYAPEEKVQCGRHCECAAGS